MSDHLHVIVTPSAVKASSLHFIDRFKGWSSRALHQAGWIGPVWQARSFDHLIRRDEDRHEIALYILGNPVRKGVCTVPEDYPWSGIPDPLDFGFESSSLPSFPT